MEIDLTVRSNFQIQFYLKYSGLTSLRSNMCSESENILWGICDVCTLAFTVAKTSSQYDRYLSTPDLKNSKTLVTYRDKEISKTAKNLVCWHDIISNSITRHKSNNYTACSKVELVDILRQTAREEFYCNCLLPTIWYPKHLQISPALRYHHY